MRDVLVRFYAQGDESIIAPATLYKVTYLYSALYVQQITAEIKLYVASDASIRCPSTQNSLHACALDMSN